MKILIIDNYDSFVHNLARYFEMAGTTPIIRRNNEITLDDIRNLNPDAIVLSPGPCTPDQAGICIDTVKTFGTTTPIFGVCLGHQAIAQSYGAKTVRSRYPLHGHASEITHNQNALFQNLPSPLKVGRYHSLTNRINACKDLTVTALTNDNIVMSIQHKTHPVYGVQFHPESILTEHGLDIIKNFIAITKDFHQQREAA